MEIRKWNFNPYGKFYSNAGNGNSIPQLELDTKTMVLKPKLDKDGKQVVYDLYSDIQKWADTNSLERILRLGDPAQIQLLDTTGENAKQVDYTKIGNAAEMATFQSKLNKQKMSLEEYLDSMKKKIMAEQESILSAMREKKQAAKKEVKENEDKK